MSSFFTLHSSSISISFVHFSLLRSSISVRSTSLVQLSFHFIRFTLFKFQSSLNSSRFVQFSTLTSLIQLRSNFRFHSFHLQTFGQSCVEFSREERSQLCCSLFFVREVSLTQLTSLVSLRSVRPHFARPLLASSSSLCSTKVSPGNSKTFSFLNFQLFFCFFLFNLLKKKQIAFVFRSKRRGFAVFAKRRDNSRVVPDSKTNSQCVATLLCVTLRFTHQLASHVRSFAVCTR